MALTLRSMRGVFDARIGLELHIVEFANLAFDLGVSATAFCALMVWPPGRDLGTRARGGAPCELERCGTNSWQGPSRLDRWSGYAGPAYGSVGKREALIVGGT